MTGQPKVQGNVSALERAIELALESLPIGPTLGAFGIAREDCALAHIDYFAQVDAVGFLLADALAHARGSDAAAIWREFGPKDKPCDCESCVGSERAQEAREKHRAAYTKVKEWVS